MADVNVKRVGVGMPERRLAVSLHGKPRLRSLSRQNDHSRRKMFTRRHRGTESRKRAIRSGEVMTGGRCRENLRLRVSGPPCEPKKWTTGTARPQHRLIQKSRRPGRFRSRLPFAFRLTSEGVPMPTSVLRKQAQPGGRKRSARAVNGGLDSHGWLFPRTANSACRPERHRTRR